MRQSRSRFEIKQKRKKIFSVPYEFWTFDAFELRRRAREFAIKGGTSLRYVFELITRAVNRRRVIVALHARNVKYKLDDIFHVSSCVTDGNTRYHYPLLISCPAMV